MISEARRETHVAFPGSLGACILLALPLGTQPLHFEKPMPQGGDLEVLGETVPIKPRLEVMPAQRATCD